MTDQLADLWTDTSNWLAGIFETMEWGEDEIEAAQRRHPAASDRLYHSFSLLKPPETMPRVEFVYRSHVRELLDRVAQGHDTRTGTAAEVCVALMEASQVAPLTSTAAGLYARMFLAAFPDQPQPAGQDLPHYESLRGPQIDDLEQDTRRRIGRANPDRQLDPSCPGRHHGQPRPDCEFHVPAQVEQMALIA